MAHSSNSRASEPEVPAAMLASRRAGWNAFTHWIVKLCLAVTVVLLLMLVFLRVL